MKSIKLIDMKKVVQVLVILLVLLIPVILSAQPLPYDQSIGGGTGGGPTGGGPGGGAPIGGGLIILLSLAIGYGTKKIFDARKKVLD